MYGRKQIVNSIDAVEQFHKRILYRISDALRANIGGRSQ